jgi:hypothetical protein
MTSQGLPDAIFKVRQVFRQSRLVCNQSVGPSVRSPQPHLFHPRQQRGWFHSEQFGCAVGAFDFPAGFGGDREQILAVTALRLGFD